MNIYAKVNETSVFTYLKVITSIADYQPSFQRVNDIFLQLGELVKKKRESLNSAENSVLQSISELKNKIHMYEVAINELRDEIHELNIQISALYQELEDDSESRASIYAKIAYLMEEKNARKREMSDKRQLLSRCNELLSQLNHVKSQISDTQNTLIRNADRLKLLQEQYNKNVSYLHEKTLNAMKSLYSLSECIFEYRNLSSGVTPVNESILSRVLAKSIGEIVFLSKKYGEAHKSSNTSEKKEYLDDGGNLYRKNNDLLPNKIIEKNGYKFETDGNGRIVKVSGKLRLDSSKNRNWDASLNDIGKGDELETDERGHLIGHRFGGPDGMENAIPQDININRDQYKLWENYLAERLEHGCEIEISISTYYSGRSHRPDGIVVYTSIDGVKQMRFFPNQSEVT